PSIPLPPVPRPTSGEPRDILNPALYEALRAWRKETAEKARVSVYAVLQQRALVSIANTLPISFGEMFKIPGIGKTTIERHGERIIQIVNSHRKREE
ncbi:MAG: HRDC domain-containing protein, partial [Odoribacteraceae bacterium]|nr:HRDC domain-containing protein [Odoribacteraceae bacterium]